MIGRVLCHLGLHVWSDTGCHAGTDPLGRPRVLVTASVCMRPRCPAEREKVGI